MRRNNSVLDTIRRSIEAEIQFRKQLLDIIDGDVTARDLKRFYDRLELKDRGDVHLSPGGDSWAIVRSRDVLRDNGFWNSEESFVFVPVEEHDTVLFEADE